MAAAGITPDCIQSLYLSLAKTAHYTPNHSTPIHPHDLERVCGALRICYCVNPKDLEFALGFQMHHDWNVTFTMGFVAPTEKKWQNRNGNPYIMLIMNIFNLLFILSGFHYPMAMHKSARFQTLPGRIGAIPKFLLWYDTSLWFHCINTKSVPHATIEKPWSTNEIKLQLLIDQ